MSTPTLVQASASGLQRAAVIAHLILAAYLLVNGLGHQIAVLVRARNGSLHSTGSLGELLGIGAGLIIAGALVTWSIAPLVNQAKPSALPALGAVAVLAAVLGLVASRFGFRFLFGSITVGLVDSALLTAFALA